MIDNVLFFQATLFSVAPLTPPFRAIFARCPIFQSYQFGEPMSFENSYFDLQNHRFQTVLPPTGRKGKKKPTMACEMCRKRKASPRILYALTCAQVKCVINDKGTPCTFCAKYSFKCFVNTARRRRGLRPGVWMLSSFSGGPDCSRAREMSRLNYSRRSFQTCPHEGTYLNPPDPFRRRPPIVSRIMGIHSPHLQFRQMWFLKAHYVCPRSLDILLNCSVSGNTFRYLRWTGSSIWGSPPLEFRESVSRVATGKIDSSAI